MQDPFGPARHALITGPLIALLGAGIIYLGASDKLPWWVIIIGGLVALVGFLRFVGGAASLAMERRRHRLLREGTQATAEIKALKQLGTRVGFPIIRMELEVSGPGVQLFEATKVGAVPVQYAPELEVGVRLPVRLDQDDNDVFAVDWPAMADGWQPTGGEGFGAELEPPR